MDENHTQYFNSLQISNENKISIRWECKHSERKTGFSP